MEVCKPRVLPADVYDALEFSALVFGGIGRLRFGDSEVLGLGVLRDGETTPCCIHGHGAFLEGREDFGRVRDALYEAGVSMSLNDMSFGPDEGRISFDEWCKRLNVVRGNQ